MLRVFENRWVVDALLFIQKQIQTFCQISRVMAIYPRN